MIRITSRLLNRVLEAGRRVHRVGEHGYPTLRDELELSVAMNDIEGRLRRLERLEGEEVLKGMAEDARRLGLDY